jgi:hypothetical protein
VRNRLLLLAILGSAALLRFTALGWGLRHPPHIDERLFVEATGRMLAAGDLDHRFYEYPGLFVYLLAPILSFFHPPKLGAGAYAAARALVGSFGVLSVFLTYRLGRAMAGARVGLLAAALLAVSPVEVRTAHMVRPDVVLESLLLLCLLAFRRIGSAAQGDLVSGASIGAATALKFSAPLIAPSYLLRRLLAPGFRWQRPLIALSASLLVFALLSPYTLINEARAGRGMWTQIAFHYRERAGEMEYAGTAAAYGEALIGTLGIPALLLALGGVVIARRAWRDWLPLLALPIAIVAVFSTATVRWERFLVPTLGVVCLFAALAGGALTSRSRWLGAAAMAAAVAVPLWSSLDYLRAIRRPSTRDLTLDWLEAHYGPGTRILMSRSFALGADARRYEITRVSRMAGLRLEAGARDLVITGPGADRALVSEMKRLYVAEPQTKFSGGRVLVLAPTEKQRPAWRPLELARARLEASTNPAGLAALCDGDLASAWRAPVAKGAWLEVTFPQPVRLGRIELIPGAPEEAPRSLRVYVASDEQPKLRRKAVALGRPPFAQQVGAQSHVLMLDGVKARVLRIVQSAPRRAPWSVAELRIDALE